ncbi:MAG: hypothetical protein MRY83_14490 [Flavobacteriales bacterium]|nr:hypothetical protein [Flavobacteriales bacterium]
MRKFLLFSVILFLFQVQVLFGQSYLPLGSLLNESFDKELNSQDMIHTSSKPLLHRDISRIISDSLWRAPYSLQKKKSLFFEPIGTIGIGLESPSPDLKLETGIGGRAMLNLNNQFYAHFGYASYNSSFFQYESDFIERRSVVNTLGQAKGTNMGYHYNLFFGDVHFVANEVFDFMIGHGKNFIGDGHRSLLLSDYAMPYSYLKANTKIWKLKLTNIWANFKNFEGKRSAYWDHPNKFGSMHFLDFQATKSLSIGLYESVIWGGRDTLNDRNFEWNYLNPVIFYRPVEYSIGSADNSLIGLNIKYKFSNSIYSYGQLIMDEFLLSEIRARNGWWANKYGYQFGLKWNDVFNVEGLNARGEFNAVRPFTFSHGRNMENYGHFNQSLAHPFGSNFQEVLGILTWSKKRLQIELKSVYARKGDNPDSLNFGADLFVDYNSRASDYGNFIGQGDFVNFFSNQLKLSYSCWKQSSLIVELGVMSRTLKYTNATDNNLYTWLSIKSSIFRSSVDYW